MGEKKSVFHKEKSDFSLYTEMNLDPMEKMSTWEKEEEAKDFQQALKNMRRRRIQIRQDGKIPRSKLDPSLVPLTQLALALPHLPSLKTIDLSGNELTCAAALNIATALVGHTPVDLSLRNNHIECRGAYFLCEHHEGIRWVSLAENGVGVWGCMKLTRAVSEEIFEDAILWGNPGVRELEANESREEAHQSREDAPESSEDARES